MGSAEPETRAGEIVAGRYALEVELAMGGMGTVWVARDEKLGRTVAIKVMRRRSLEAFADARERFEREARAAAALRSAHVVAVHDYGIDDDLPFIAMELLEGESLKERLERVGAFSVQGAAEILRQVAKGLKAAHRAGLVHRDLKPSNIFLAQRDDEEVVKLLDFGVVKSAGRRASDETASGVLLGTPQYMSPEQARGNKAIDHRADIWSLAVILYEMLVGENPFNSEAEAVGDIVIRVCVEPITPPTVMRPDLPESLDAFFEVALARDPAERFQSSQELAEGFLLAADLSFGGFDDRSTETSGRGLLAPPEGAQLDSGRTSPPPSPHEIEDASSAGASMATTVDGPAPRGGRRAAIVALVAAIGVGVGFGAHALLRTSGAPASAASSPPPVVEAPAPARPSPPPVLPRPEPTASAASSALANPAPPPTARQSAAFRPPPKVPASTEPGGAAGGPPTWYKAPE